MLFRLVARFARVRNGDSSRNRFASTAYFAWGETSGAEKTGGKHRGGNFREGKGPSTVLDAFVLTYVSCLARYGLYKIHRLANTVIYSRRIKILVFSE